MPFTPFHLGPALGLGLPLRKYIHTPTFILASVIIDVEPFLVLVLGLRYPLHGYLHTFLLFFVGLVLGCAMFLLERLLRPTYQMFLLEPSVELNLTSFTLAGTSGTALHVLLDSPLYGDTRPFYPLAANPLHNPAVCLEVYSTCVWFGIFGIVYYIGLLTFLVYKRTRKQ